MRVYSSVVKLLAIMHEAWAEGVVKYLGKKRGNKNRKVWTSKNVIKYLKCITIL